jgi:hypothetical protein
VESEKSASAPFRKPRSRRGRAPRTGHFPVFRTIGSGHYCPGARGRGDSGPPELGRPENAAVRHRRGPRKNKGPRGREKRRSRRRRHGAAVAHAAFPHPPTPSRTLPHPTSPYRTASDPFAFRPLGFIALDTFLPSFLPSCAGVKAIPRKL